MTSTQDTKEQAQQTASTAVDEGKHVASVAGEEAQNVAGQAKDQARVLLDDALGQVEEQSRTQRDNLVSTLQSLTTDLDAMASSGNSGLAAQLTQQVADRARTLSTHLDGREPADLLQDVRQFARQRPALFLVGAVGAGVLVGRLARGAKQANQSDGPSETAYGTTTTPASPVSAPSYGQPTIAAPIPPAEPAYPGTGGFADENGAGTGPQGFLP